MFQIIFSCRECSLLRQTVEVRYREKEEKIEVWFDYIGGVMARCHSANSPFCRSREMSDVMIPAPVGDEKVGMEPEEKKS